MKRPRFRPSGATVWIPKVAARHQGQEAAAGGGTRSRLRPSEYPASGDRFLFPGGRICDYINEKWGWDKLLAMMHDFANSRSHRRRDPQGAGDRARGIRQGISGRGSRSDTKTTVDGLDDWLKKMKEVDKLPQRDKYDEVIKEGKPRFATCIRITWKRGSVYELLAEAYEAKDDKPAAIAELERYRKHGGRSPATLEETRRAAEPRRDARRKPPPRWSGSITSLRRTMECTSGWAIWIWRSATSRRGDP